MCFLTGLRVHARPLLGVTSDSLPVPCPRGGLTHIDAHDPPILQLCSLSRGSSSPPPFTGPADAQAALGEPDDSERAALGAPARPSPLTAHEADVQEHNELQLTASQGNHRVADTASPALQPPQACAQEGTSASPSPGRPARCPTPARAASASHLGGSPHARGVGWGGGGWPCFVPLISQARRVAQP